MQENMENMRIGLKTRTEASQGTWLQLGHFQTVACLTGMLIAAAVIQTSTMLSCLETSASGATLPSFLPVQRTAASTALLRLPYNFLIPPLPSITVSVVA